MHADVLGFQIHFLFEIPEILNGNDHVQQKAPLENGANVLKRPQPEPLDDGNHLSKKVNRS